MNTESTSTTLSPGLPPPQPYQRGGTLLLVEDSRLTADYVRLLFRGAGGRLRRADCLRSARRHMSLYTPDAAIVDLGLPDGSGLDLIAEMARQAALGPGLFGWPTSGNPRERRRKRSLAGARLRFAAPKPFGTRGLAISRKCLRRVCFSACAVQMCKNPSPPTQAALRLAKTCKFWRCDSLPEWTEARGPPIAGQSLSRTWLFCMTLGDFAWE